MYCSKELAKTKYLRFGDGSDVFIDHPFILKNHPGIKIKLQMIGNETYLKRNKT